MYRSAASIAASSCRYRLPPPFVHHFCGLPAALLMRAWLTPLRNASHGGTIIRAVENQNMRMVRHDGAAANPPIPFSCSPDQSACGDKSLLIRQPNGVVLLAILSVSMRVGVIGCIGRVWNILLGGSRLVRRECVGNVTARITGQPRTIAGPSDEQCEWFVVHCRLSSVKV